MANLNLDSSKLMQQMYRNLEGKIVYDLQNAALGIYDANGNLVTLGKAANGHKKLVTSPIDLSVAVPAIAIRTKVSDLKSGDMVFDPNDNTCGFFVKTEKAKTVKEGEKGNEEDLDNDTVTILKAGGNRSTVVVAENPMLGAGVLAVRSFMNAGMDNALPLMLMMNQGYSNNGDLGKMIAISMATGQNIFGGLGEGENAMANLLPLMLMGEGKTDMKQILMLSMMNQTQGQGGENPMASLLPMMLMGEGKMDKKMMAMMMLSQGQAGGNANIMPFLMLDLFRG